MGYVHSDLDFAFDVLFLLLIVWFSSASSLLPIIWTRDPALLLFCILPPSQLISVLLWWPWTLKQSRLFCHIFTNCQGSCYHTCGTMNAFWRLEELTLSLFLFLNKQHLICFYTAEWTEQKKSGNSYSVDWILTFLLSFKNVYINHKYTFIHFIILIFKIFATLVVRKLFSQIIE